MDKASRQVNSESNAESRKKLDEQRKRLQRQLRDVERLTDLPQETQSGIKENLQRQLHEFVQKRHDLLPEHQRVQKRSQEIQEKHAEDEMRKIGEEIVKDCMQVKKEEAAMHRKQVIAAWRRCGNSLSLWERIESRLCSKGTEKLELPRADARRRRRRKEKGQ